MGSTMGSTTGSTEASDDRGAAPKPWAAVLLSLLCTGLGQMYCGRMRRGLVFFLLSLLFAPAVSLAFEAPTSTAALSILCGTLLGAAALFLVSVVDAWRLARRLRSAPHGGPGMGAGLYVLFVVVGLVYPLGAVLLLRAHSLEAFKIAGRSMEPTLRLGDRVLVDKGAWTVGGPERGDVVVFRFRDETGRSRHYIKRVIALSGDRVEIRGGEVRVNGRALPNSPAPEAGEGVLRESAGTRDYLIQDVRPPSGETGESGAGDYPEQEVPAGHFFLLGDRRERSCESLRFSTVPRSDVVGPVRYLFWPAGSWGRFGPLP